MWRSDRLRVRGAALALGFATLLGGCADIYYDRRETVTFYAGDAVASNKVVQMIDPWPRAAANRNIESHGERMQRAAGLRPLEAGGVTAETPAGATIGTV